MMMRYVGGVMVKTKVGRGKRRRENKTKVKMETQRKQKQVSGAVSTAGDPLVSSISAGAEPCCLCKTCTTKLPIQSKTHV